MAIITKRTAIVGVLLIVALAGFIKFFWKPEDTTRGVQTVSEKTSTGESVKSVPSTSTVKSLRSETSYKTPGGKYNIVFVLGVDANGIIRDTTVEILTQNKTSKGKQESFAAGLSEVLVGKDLKTLSDIDRVGGASLTTSAFNAALAGLKAQM